MTTHIVIPIGVAAPGTPVLSLLEKSIDSILNQTSKDFILTVASDTDVSDECKKLLEEKKLNVRWHEPGTFFRRGGIWKKITDAWQAVDSKYVAFLHYDDFWHEEKLSKQIELMEQWDLGCSWAETYVVDGADNLVSGDCAYWNSFSKETIGSRTVAFAHSAIMRKEDFFNSGIMAHELRWAPCFEDLFTMYAHSTSGRKAVGAKFYWRDHSLNMSNTLCTWTQPNSQWREEVLKQQAASSYSNSEVSDDDRIVRESARNFYTQTISKYA